MTKEMCQIGVSSLNVSLRDAFQKIVMENFGEDMAGFLRNIVEEVVVTYGTFTVKEKVAMNLGNKIIGGPVYMRMVLRDWKTKHPDLEQQIALEEAVSQRGSR